MLQLACLPACLFACLMCGSALFCSRSTDIVTHFEGCDTKLFLALPPATPSVAPQPTVALPCFTCHPFFTPQYPWCAHLRRCRDGRHLHGHACRCGCRYHCPPVLPRWLLPLWQALKALPRAFRGTFKSRTDWWGVSHGRLYRFRDATGAPAKYPPRAREGVAEQGDSAGREPTGGGLEAAISGWSGGGRGR